mmetsp:Transcript_58229/g.115581  ORF Transcript_58229/g.115581 Transcript_58229/m.115581 type:complete len:273 (+) Transcript_58229:81-899(+)
MLVALVRGLFASICLSIAHIEIASTIDYQPQSASSSSRNASSSSFVSKPNAFNSACNASSAFRSSSVRAASLAAWAAAAASAASLSASSIAALASSSSAIFLAAASIATFAAASSAAFLASASASRASASRISNCCLAATFASALVFRSTSCMARSASRPADASCIHLPCTSNPSFRCARVSKLFGRVALQPATFRSLSCGQWGAAGRATSLSHHDTSSCVRASHSARALGRLMSDLHPDRIRTSRDKQTPIDSGSVKSFAQCGRSRMRSWV